MSNKIKAYNFFRKYPGHLKTATIDIAERLDIDYDAVSKGRALYREFGDVLPTDSELITSKTNFKDEAKTYDSVDDYEKFLKDNKIEEEDVVQVYYKQKADGIRFTVQTRHDKQEEPDKEQLYEYLKQYNFNKDNYRIDYEPDNTFAVLNLFDAHIDKLAYTGKGGYWEAKANAEHLLVKANVLLDDIYKHNPERIVLPIGNDFFNTNDANPATKKGTPQPYTMHWEDAFKLGVWFYRSLIDYIKEFTDVHIINIPGNHDKDKSFYLGEVIKALYEDDDQVTTDLNKDKRKYFFIHKVLLGFAHGDVEKRRIKDLPTAMSIEKPTAWGQAKYRTWILGDIHHKERYKSLTTLEHNGVDIQFFRPATSADRWHTDSLWIHAKKSLSYIIYRDNASRITTDELFI